MKDNLRKIDFELEKIVFLINAQEGNAGIYELTWEFEMYKLEIENVYKITHEILKELLGEEFITLDKYKDLTCENKIETVPFELTEKILNNPSNWYPCNEIYSITLTEKGNTFLDEKIPEFGAKLENRLFGNKK